MRKECNAWLCKERELTSGYLYNIEYVKNYSQQKKFVSQQFIWFLTANADIIKVTVNF